MEPEITFIYQGNKSLVFIPNKEFKYLSAKIKKEMIQKMIFSLEQELLSNQAMKNLAPSLLQERFDS